MIISTYKRIVLALVLLGSLILSTQSMGAPCVILLHGLGRSHHAMAPMANYLKTAHFTVINQDYPTTKKSIHDLAEEELPPMIHLCLQHHPEKIHFVTHSIGGIVLRQYLAKHTVPHLGRIVMLSPPNHGSPLADLLHHNSIFKQLTGPAGQELMTTSTSTPNQLPKSIAPYSVGIIAGHIHLLDNILFHEMNDGIVPLSSMHLNGATDFIILPVSHTFMMRRTVVMQQVVTFLNSGHFLHAHIA
jgi:pimeloyl-ACP methyl ester carboxylesterase